MKGKIKQLLQSLIFAPVIFLLVCSDNIYSARHVLFSRDTSDFAYTAPDSFLGLWTDGFKALRIALSKKPFPTSILPSEGLSLATIYTAPIVQYHFGALVFLAVLFLLLVLLCVSGCVMCCNSCCCSARLNRKYSKMKTPGVLKKTCAFLCLLIPSLLSGICIYIHLAGNQHLSKGLANTKSAAVNLLADSQNFFVELVPNFSESIDSLGGSINTSIDDLISSVNFDDFTTKVKPAFFEITAAMYSIENSKEEVIAVYPGIVDNTTYLQQNATFLQSLIANISARINQLSQPNRFLIAPYTNDNWTLITPINSNLDANSVKSSADSSPDTESIFGSLESSVNLTASALDIEAKINDGISSAQTTVTNTSTNLKNDITVSLSSGKSAISTGLEAVTESLGVSNYINQINTSWVTILEYDNLRNYGQMGLVLLFCLPVLIISIGGALRSHAVMKGANLACVPYYALLFFCAIIFLLFSVILGDVCTLVFDETPSSMGPLLLAQTGTNLISTNESFGSLFHKCVTGSTLLDVASSFGFNTSSFNFSSIANDKINELNFNEIGNVNLSSAVSLNSDPSADASSTDVDLSSLTVAPFLTVISETNALKANLTSLSNQLSDLLGNQTILTNWNTSDSAQTNQAYREFNSSVNYIIGNISYANQMIDLMQSLSAYLNVSVISVNSTANAMLATIGTISPLYNSSMEQFDYFAANATQNLTDAIDPLKNSLKAAISTLSFNINADLKCETIGSDVAEVRQGLCGDTMAALDSFWSSIVIMALCALVSLPLTVFAANTLFLDLTRYQQMDDPEFSGKKDEDLEQGKPSGETDKSKKVTEHAFAPINVLKTQEYMSPTSNPPLNEDADDEDDEESDNDEEEQDKEVMVEIDKKEDQQLEFESRQANISIQSDLMSFSPASVKPSNIMEEVPESSYDAPVPSEQPIYPDFVADQITQSQNDQSQVVEFIPVQSQSAIINEQELESFPLGAQTLEQLPSNDATLEAFPSNPVDAGSFPPPINPLVENLKGKEAPKRKKTLLDIDKIQANSFSQTKQSSFGSSVVRQRANSDINRVNSEVVVKKEEQQPLDVATTSSPPSNDINPEPSQSLQAEVDQLRQSLPTEELLRTDSAHYPVSAIPKNLLEEVRDDGAQSQPRGSTDSLGSLQSRPSRPQVPKSAKPMASMRRSPSSEPSDVAHAKSASSEVTAIEVVSSQQDMDKSQLQQSLPKPLLTDISNPAAAKRLSSFSPDMYSPPKVEPVAEGTKPSVPYDDLITLSKRFKLPELVKVAETLSVEQVAAMDVIEAEGFGISRDAYFKLKRYFISRRKYV